MESLIWKDLIEKMAVQYGIDMALLLAVVETESGGNQWVSRYEAQYSYLFEPRQIAANLGISMATEEVLQKTSWGLMQPMGGVCRELGYMDHLTKMTDPRLSMSYGCKYLKKKMQRFGMDECTVYAAYNAGSPRKTPGGLFVNQKAVDRFYQNLLKAYEALK